MKTITYIPSNSSIEKAHSKYHKSRARTNHYIQHLKIYDQELLQVSNKYGLIISVVLILFFLVMKYFDMHYKISLRYVNLFFLFAGIYFALLFYARKYHKINYHTGFKIGLRVSLVAITPFTLFIWLYLETNPYFMNFINALLSDVEGGKFITPTIALIGLWAEAMCLGIISTMIVLKHLKRKHKEALTS